WLLPVIFLHATDLRQVPFILTFGLFSGIGRAPLAIGDEKGKAYTRQIVARQLRKGWEIVVLGFDIPATWATEAEEPAGVGFDLVPSHQPPTLPPPLLEELATILPQGPGIVRAFVEWHREGRLVWLAPNHLDRSATLRVNETLVEVGILPASTLAELEEILDRGAKGQPSD
ncbi:MAG: hypothetical protein V3T26_04390, partial [candidate division NC10 bacterium]